MSDPVSILPPNSTRAERALESAVTRTSPDLSPIAALMNTETCPAPLLPTLAWALSVDEFDIGWPVHVQRGAIRESVEIHRRKGTVGSVQRALAAAGYGDAQVVERFGDDSFNGEAVHDGSIYYSPPDHWAEYRVRLTRPVSLKQADQIRAILAATAPARASLKALDFTEAANLYNASSFYDGQYSHGVA